MAFLRCREHEPVQRRIVADHRVSVHRNIKAAGLNEVMIVVITFACYERKVERLVDGETDSANVVRILARLV
jgi:hypothetical protein